MSSRYLKEVNNFKMRYKKLLNMLSKRIHMSNWFKFFKVGRFDILARCINPIIRNKDLNQETILRRNVFKTLYKYCSMALNRSLLVKEIVTKDDEPSKLMFIYISWITPNFCALYMGFYNNVRLEKYDFLYRYNVWKEKNF